MSDVDEFANFFGPEKPDGIDIAAFKKFLEQYGPDVTKGFLMAMVYMQPKVRDVYCGKYRENPRPNESTFAINSYDTTLNRANELNFHIDDLLQIGSALTGYPEQSYLNGVKIPRRKLED